MPSPVALLTGMMLDAAFGDPPNAAHPVAWFGSAAATFDRALPRTRVAGVVAACGLVMAAGTAGAQVERTAGRAGATAVLWAATSRRTLLRRATEVAAALEANDLAAARTLLARHLVSRDTSTLDAADVAGATIESVAENLSDAVVAPWCWYVAGGSAAVAGYRALNTLDGMWGYRTPAYEAFGWAAARGDDLANLVPARLTALALILACGEDAGRAFHAWRADRSLTESPNAGHPMAAMAGALGVVLRKRGQYTLNVDGRDPDAADVRRAVLLADRASAIALVAALVACEARR